MARAVKLIQITDLHLRAEPDAVLHGWHVDDAWHRVADDAMTRHPDADVWVLTGDLVDDESAAGYTRLDNDLAGLSCPVLALAGNHDDPDAMRRYLRHAHVHTRIAIGDWQLHALDSHVQASEAGRLGETQIARLAAALQEHPGPAAICVHHPPIQLGSRWLDGIGLGDAGDLRRLLRAQPQVAAVVCGHAHQAFEARIGDAMCWATPSTMRQFRPGAAAFAADHEARPGYRVVRLHADGHADSHVQRVDGYLG